MKKAYIILNVETILDTQERVILFDNVLQKCLDTTFAGQIILTIPEFRTINEKRVTVGFKMEILLNDLDIGIKCIKQVLNNLNSYSYHINVRNDLNEWILYESNSGNQ